jgi:hypothetical protein
MFVPNRGDVGIGVFNAEVGLEVRLGGSALRAVGADCGRRGARFSLFAALRNESSWHANPSWREQPRPTGPTRPCRIWGRPDAPRQNRQPNTCQLTCGRRLSCHGTGKRFRSSFNNSLQADTWLRVRECFLTTLTMFSRPMKKSNVLTSGQQQWVNLCAPSRLVRLHFVAAVDTKKANGRVRLVSARTALHARARAKVAGETR